MIHIGQVIVPPAVAEKIGSKHGLWEQDVRDAVQWPAQVLLASWLEPPDDPRGPRLVVKGLTATGRPIKVVLYPVDQTDGTWRLGTRTPRQRTGGEGRMGHVDKNWRNKDDADLTSEDLDEMLAAGKPVIVGGPVPPGGAVLNSVSPNLPGNVIPLPSRVFQRQAQVSAQVAL